MYAWLFPLFEIRKATTLNISTGIKYAIQPNKPNNTDDTASPTIPPMPKLLINRKYIQQVRIKYIFRRELQHFPAAVF